MKNLYKKFDLLLLLGVLFSSSFINAKTSARPCTPTSSDTTVVACDSYTWFGTTYYSTPSVAPTKVLTNVEGCDSTITLHLTINSSPSIKLTGSNCFDHSELTAAFSKNTKSLVWSSNDADLSTVESFGSEPVLTTIAGKGSSGNGLDELNQPTDITYGPDGALYITDTYNHRVMRYEPNATSGTIYAGGNGQGSALNQLNGPYGLEFDKDGNLYVADLNNQRILQFPPNSNSTTNGVDIINGYGQPLGLTISKDDSLYVTYGSQVLKFGLSGGTGRVVAGTGTNGSASNQINNAICIAVDADNNLYCSEANSGRVTKWAPGATSGVIIAGIGSGNGTGAKELYNMRGIAFDANGNLYVSNEGQLGIKKFAAGSVSGDEGITLEGTPNNVFVPFGLEFNADGNLVIADYNNNRIKVVSLTYNAAFTPDSAGTYVAKVTSPDGCENTAFFVINKTYDITETVVTCGSYTWGDSTYTSTPSEYPVNHLESVSGCDSIVTLHLTIDTLDLTTTLDSLTISANQENADSYKWIDCATKTAINNATSAQFTATENGDYAVVVTKGDCSDTSECVIITGIVAGIKEINSMNTSHISVFPNPTANVFTVRGENIKSMKIVNVMGEIVYQSVSVITSEDNLIDITNQAVGIYTLQVVTNSGTSQHRIVKQ